MMGGGERLEGAAPQDSKEGSGFPTKKDSYGELRAIWARPWDDDEDADRRAYARAIKQGADPGEILDAARAHVEAADAPRFLKPLAVWLDREGWRRPPPAKRSRRNGWRKPDACKAVLGLVGYVEDDDGRMVFQ